MSHLALEPVAQDSGAGSVLNDPRTGAGSRGTTSVDPSRSPLRRRDVLLPLPAVRGLAPRHPRNGGSRLPYSTPGAVLCVLQVAAAGVNRPSCCPGPFQSPGSFPGWTRRAERLSVIAVLYAIWLASVSPAGAALPHADGVTYRHHRADLAQNHASRDGLPIADRIGITLRNDPGPLERAHPVQNAACVPRRHIQHDVAHGEGCRARHKAHVARPERWRHGAARDADDRKPPGSQRVRHAREERDACKACRSTNTARGHQCDCSASTYSDTLA